MTARRPKDIGTDAERAIARYLQANGWPHAEQRRTHGRVDLGDITGTPGIVWEVKGGHTAEQAGDQQVTDWLAEATRERDNANAAVGILVWKRKAKGPSSAGDWWAAMQAVEFAELVADRPLAVNPATGGSWPAAAAAPVRMLLRDLVQLLRAAGYGNPPEVHA